MNVVEIRNLTKIYKSFKLDNINLDIPAGCILGLIGENGAGKSTLIKLITDSVKATEGTVKVFGIDNQSKKFIFLKNDIGVVLDEAYFPYLLNSKDIGKIMKDTYKNWNMELYEEYMKRFNIPEKTKFSDFSRGMKMKFSIAVTLSHSPKLLVLDEATSGLDPIVRDEILDVFNDFTRDEKHTVIMSSHILSDLEKICDYIAFIHKGRLIMCEEKDRLLEEYAVLKVSKEELDDIPTDAIISKIDTAYGVSLLVKNSQVSASFNREHSTLEDIILFIAKGGNDYESFN